MLRHTALNEFTHRLSNYLQLEKYLVFFDFFVKSIKCKMDGISFKNIRGNSNLV